jgi:hypothetical protein
MLEVIRPVLVLVAFVALVSCSDRRVELFPQDSAVTAGDLGLDAALPDARSSCVCRVRLCRTDGDCQRAIDPASTCQTAIAICTGAGAACLSASDCDATTPSAWLCATGATSDVSCP